MTASVCRICGKPDPFDPNGMPEHDECNAIIERHAREHHGGTYGGPDDCPLCVYGDTPMGAHLPAARLEYLRGEIEAERISMSEIAELQSLAEHIDPSDVQLLQWAGVPEFPEEDEALPFTPYADLAQADADWAMGEDGPGACSTCGRNPALEAAPCHDRVRRHVDGIRDDDEYRRSDQWA